jgi:hypothetical protein
MTMGVTFGITMLFVGLMVVLPAVWLLYGALWPAALGRAQERIQRRPIVTFLVGLGVSALFSFLIAILGQANLQPPAIVLASFAIGWSLFGVSALARHAGTRLGRLSEPGWRGHLRGGIVLALSFLVPMVGWMLVFPISMILGAGAATLSLSRKRAETPEPVPAPKEPAQEEMLA